MRRSLALLAIVVLCAGAARAPSAAAVMAAWDDDGDGALSKAEWLAGGRDAKSFAYADVNHDGKVSMAELKVALVKARKAGQFGR